MLSPMPDIGEVTGQPAGQEEDGVDADVVAFARVTRRQPLRGDRHPPQPILIERHRQRLLATARLDLDEGQGPATAGDEIDFTAGYTGPLRKDSPAAQPQPPGREPFRAPAAPLGLHTAVQRLSSRARA